MPYPADGKTSVVREITDGTLGTASSAVPEITSSYVEATIANAYATLIAAHNEVRAALLKAGIISE